MGELIVQLLEKVSNPALIAAIIALILAFQAIVRALGEVMIAIGKSGKFKNQDDDFFDKYGSKVRKLTVLIGKGVAWLGIGNKQRK